MLHHECPVTILSPEDSQVIVDRPGINYRFGGRRAYIGQDSLDRQRRHLGILLEYPENYFMVHDSDSVCLDAKIPDYLYAEPDLLWSNQVFDDIPEHQGQFGDWPRVAFQPPYFLSRRTIEAMLAVADDPRVQASPVMPFIDFYMVQLGMVAGLPWRRFMDCISCPITADPLKELTPNQAKTYNENYAAVYQSVLHRGANILHSVKDPVAVDALLGARRNFLMGHPDAVPHVTLAPRVGGAKGPHRGTVSGPHIGLKA
jgi:hypothetical protein